MIGTLGITADDVRPPDIDETPLPGELPRAYCARVTRAKADAMDVAPGEIALCADTTVALGRRIMGKPANAGEAAEFLHMLSGRRHKVITCVAVRSAKQLWEREVVTTVKMKRLSNEEVNAYLASGDWQGKAGAYGIQGPAGAFIPWLEGSYTGVMGLPVAETATLLAAAGYSVYGGWE